MYESLNIPEQVAEYILNCELPDDQQIDVHVGVIEAIGYEGWREEASRLSGDSLFIDFVSSGNERKVTTQCKETLLIKNTYIINFVTDRTTPDTNYMPNMIRYRDNLIEWSAWANSGRPPWNQTPGQYTPRELPPDHIPRFSHIRNRDGTIRFIESDDERIEVQNAQFMGAVTENNRNKQYSMNIAVYYTVEIGAN